MNPYHRQGALHPSQAAHAAQAVITQQAQDLAALQTEHTQLQAMYEQFFQVYRNPPQLRAGVIEYPDRRPFLYLYRKELKGKNNETFGKAPLSAGKVQATFQFDASRPVYLPKLQFALLRTAHDNPSAFIPLNTYLPLAGMMPNGAKGLDFRWKASTSKGDLNWTSGWIDSAVFALHDGYELPIENPIDEDSVLTIEVESWGAADTTQNEAFSLFCILHTYKMRAVEQ
jgi:hypothetical protein